MNLKNLTVIVGANATGKSNLIKGIQFLSDLVTLGLKEAIYRRGGYTEIIPKMHKKAYGLIIRFSIDFELSPPRDWAHLGLPPLKASYVIGITQSKQRNLRIVQEVLTVKHCLLNAYFFKEGIDRNNVKEKLSPEIVESLIDTDIKLIRKGENVNYEINFDYSERNIQLLYYWLGLEDFLEEKVTSQKIGVTQIKKLAQYTINTIRPENDKRYELILSSDRFIENFSIHFRRIVEEISSFAKYDLLINELRQEQSVTKSQRVSSSGDNVPGVTKRIMGKDKVEAFERILTTMANISPYFKTVRSKSLRAGKEYLLFSEIFGGKDIEAWESSDGTLRAYSILLAIETHPEGSIVMIEEPEHGLHPWAIKDLILHIREAVKVRDIQVIITTHSQQVLECIEPSELLITERDASGTRFISVADFNFREKITMGEIGDLWVRGLLKGVPISL